jgi:prolyl oligopeptidase
MTRILALIALAVLLAGCSKEAPEPEKSAPVAAESAAPATVAELEDPFLWLEEVDGEDALAWVDEQNDISLAYLESLPSFEPLFERNLEIYNSDERIPTVAIRNDHVFNHWKDADNKRGLWRRMKLADYLAGSADWDVLLDLDALAEAETEDWVWKGASCLRPDYRRCLLNLSRGGADAVVVREFDVIERSFVEDGFTLPEAKSTIAWIDADTVFVGTDFGPGSMTDSGYPMSTRRWSRGEALEEAPVVFTGESTDVSAGAYRGWDGDRPYDIVDQTPSFFTSHNYLLDGDGQMQRIQIPDDAVFRGVFRGQLLVTLRSDWDVGEDTYPQGALLSADFESFMAGGRDFQVVFEPGDGVFLARSGLATTKDFLVLNLLDNVVSRLMRFEFVDGAWVGEDIDAPTNGTIRISTASDESNDLFFLYEGFLLPDTLFHSRDGGQTVTARKSLPEFFDTDGMTVEQHFATSKDGTRVPYFLVLPKGFVANGSTPTLMYGYGGYQISRTPSYSATVGHSWLARGGAYVVANIRGGGEYGPAWHLAAQKENKQRSYDDFIAIAEDLVRRRITSPQHLGIRGGSNGGLLTGVMLTQRPDLFGGVVVQVPLLDMKRFNRLLAGASWMAEYGDPDTDDWEYIKEYSPYHNLDPDQDYPKAFFTTSTRDDRVHPAHARKMVARMNEMGIDLLYFENTVGGHAGASDNSQAARNEALIYSYLWDQLKE